MGTLPLSQMDVDGKVSMNNLCEGV
jgi:hypothetical protein